jgi:hypothetical protein
VCLLMTAARQDFQKILEANAALKHAAADAAAQHVAELETAGEFGNVLEAGEDEGTTPQHSRSQHPFGAGEGSQQSPLLATLEAAALLSTGPALLEEGALSLAGSPGASQTLLGVQRVSTCAFVTHAF